jgi:predicted HAD superfamily Cof-like phosphohydrolase
MDLTIKDYEDVWNLMLAHWRTDADTKARREAYMCSWQRQKFDVEELKAVIFKLADTQKFFPLIAEINHEMLWKQKGRALTKRLEDGTVDPDGQAKVREILAMIFEGAKDPMEF